MKQRRILASVIKIVFGVILSACGFGGIVDEFWSGMGVAFVVIGVLQLIRQIRYMTNEEYKETVDIATKDERNKYLSLKAWSWAGYCFVIIAAVATILLKLAGMEDFMMLTSGSVCLMLLLYWGAYMILRRKY